MNRERRQIATKSVNDIATALAEPSLEGKGRDGDAETTRTVEPAEGQAEETKTQRESEEKARRGDGSVRKRVRFADGSAEQEVATRGSDARIHTRSSGSRTAGRYDLRKKNKINYKL